MMNMKERIKNISLENLRSYLGQHGWEHAATYTDKENEIWFRGHHGYQSVIKIPIKSELEKLLEWLANKEKRPLLDIIEEIEQMGDGKANAREDEDQYRVQVVCDVFRAINTLIRNGGGSFRYLIYDLLGLPESTYGELMNAGGLGITNWISDQIETSDKMRKVLKNALANAKREADGWNEIVRTIEDALSAGGEW